jgi:hypothetical protein
MKLLSSLTFLAALTTAATVVRRDEPSRPLSGRAVSSTSLALKRDWNLNASDVKQLGLSKTPYKMLWTLDSVALGSC